MTILRFIAAVTVVALALLVPLRTVDADETPPVSVLNDRVVVSENVVRLGDLFTNVETNAEAAVAYAPEPGKRAIFDARWLYRVASAYGVRWQPMGQGVHAIVERDAVAVPSEDIKAALLFALADFGVDPDMDIELATRMQHLFLPAGGLPEVNVESIDYIARTGRFSAVVAAGNGRDVQRMRISGRTFRSIEVPVLGARVLRGDVIEEHHIQWVRMKADRVQRDIIVDAADLIGKTPRRGIRAGSPIRNADVVRPQLVEKKSLVTIIHKVPNMMLTAQGRALEGGADGDVIRIENVRSDQVIEAEVIGPGRVAVRSLSHQLSMSLN